MTRSLHGGVMSVVSVLRRFWTRFSCCLPWGIWYSLSNYTAVDRKGSEDFRKGGGGKREIPASVKNACRLFSCLLWEGAGGGNVREQDAHLVWSNKSPRAHGSPWQGEHATTVTKKLLATSTSPIMHLICPPKFCITFVFHFSWVLQPS